MSDIRIFCLLSPHATATTLQIRYQSERVWWWPQHVCATECEQSRNCCAWLLQTLLWNSFFLLLLVHWSSFRVCVYAYSDGTQYRMNRNEQINMKIDVEIDFKAIFNFLRWFDGCARLFLVLFSPWVESACTNYRNQVQSHETLKKYCRFHFCVVFHIPITVYSRCACVRVRVVHLLTHIFFSRFPF